MNSSGSVCFVFHWMRKFLFDIFLPNDEDFTFIYSDLMMKSYQNFWWFSCLVNERNVETIKMVIFMILLMQFTIKFTLICIILFPVNIFFITFQTSGVWTPNKNDKIKSCELSLSCKIPLKQNHRCVNLKEFLNEIYII